MTRALAAGIKGAKLGAALLAGVLLAGGLSGGALAWDYRDGPHYGGPRYDGPRFHGPRYEGPAWGGFHDRGYWSPPVGPRWRPGPPRYRGPDVVLLPGPPILYQPAPPLVVLSTCQQTVGDGLVERYGPGSIVFSGGPFEGVVTLDQRPFNYRCADGRINVW
ncbi:hypothetical protein [Skermanella stibiiresistens]|nr:hypothetical protein [Skermanella stibiiresistens]